MFDLLKKLQFKNDGRLIAFAVALALVTGGLIAHKDVTAKEGLAFLGGALALPGLFGAATKDEETKENHDGP